MVMMMMADVDDGVGRWPVDKSTMLDDMASRPVNLVDIHLHRKNAGIDIDPAWR